MNNNDRHINNIRVVAFDALEYLETELHDMREYDLLKEAVSKRDTGYTTIWKSLNDFQSDCNDNLADIDQHFIYFVNVSDEDYNNAGW